MKEPKLDWERISRRLFFGRSVREESLDSFFMGVDELVCEGDEALAFGSFLIAE
jgi:hypothetical protein